MKPFIKSILISSSVATAVGIGVAIALIIYKYQDKPDSYQNIIYVPLYLFGMFFPFLVLNYAIIYGLKKAFLKEAGKLKLFSIYLAYFFIIFSAFSIHETYAFDFTTVMYMLILSMFLSFCAIIPNLARV